MEQTFNWIIMAIFAFAGLHTLWSILRRPAVLIKDALNDEDRMLVWKLVLFLILPALVFLDLRTTNVIAESLGGCLSNIHYGVLWYHAEPQGISQGPLLLAVLFAGVVAQLLFAICLLPALCFRPHPFLATAVGYTFVLIFAINLVVDPLLGFAGIGSSKWHLAMQAVSPVQLTIVLALYTVVSVCFLLIIRSRAVRLWFAERSRPLVAEQLRIAFSEAKANPESHFLICRIGLLLEKAGLHRQAAREMERLRQHSSDSLYLPFLAGYLYYRNREYKRAKKAFIQASNFPNISDDLRSEFLGAAACAAFAKGNVTNALDLAEASLEFNDNNLVSRMVKVDVYLKLGKREPAAEEVVEAVRRGLDFDLSDRIPLDTDSVLSEIGRRDGVGIIRRTLATR